MIGLAEDAFLEVKGDKETLFYEEAVNFDYLERTDEEITKVILMIILRGESPVVIPIKFQFNSNNEEKTQDRKIVEEIKLQIKKFIKSYKEEFPRIFRVCDLLDADREIRKWFYGFEAVLICENCSREVVLKQNHYENFSRKMKIKAENITVTNIEKFVANGSLFCSKCKAKDINLNITKFSIEEVTL